MHIWIINQYAGSSHHGMNYRSYYLGKGFVEKGYKVTLFSASYSHLYSKLPEIKGQFTEETIDGIDYIWVKVPTYKSSKSIGRVWSMLIFFLKLLFFNVKSIGKPDQIIISSLSIFPVVNAYIWSKKFNINFIFEVRDIWPLTLVELGSFSPKHPLVQFIGFFEKFGYKKAKYVVSLLPKAKEHMVDKGMKEEKFVYIPNGIDLGELQSPMSLPDETKTMIPGDKFIIGYTGTIGIANAVDYLLFAANILKTDSNIHFVIVGHGGEKSKLLDYINEHSLTNVTMVDSIPKKQIPSILKLFDVCYIGLKNEPLFKFGVSPNKLFDYMYSAKPIIYAINSGNKPVKEAKCGISIDAESTEAVVDAIKTFSSMPDIERNVLGQNGKKYVEKNHSYGSIVNRYVELFEK